MPLLISLLFTQTSVFELKWLPCTKIRTHRWIVFTSPVGDLTYHFGDSMSKKWHCCPCLPVSQLTPSAVARHRARQDKTNKWLRLTCIIHLILIGLSCGSIATVLTGWHTDCTVYRYCRHLRKQKLYERLPSKQSNETSEKTEGPGTSCLRAGIKDLSPPHLLACALLVASYLQLCLDFFPANDLSANISTTPEYKCFKNAN